MYTIQDKFRAVESYHKDLVETSGMSQNYIKECAAHYRNLAENEMSFQRPLLAAQARGFAMGYESALR